MVVGELDSRCASIGVSAGSFLRPVRRKSMVIVSSVMLGYRAAISFLLNLQGFIYEFIDSVWVQCNGLCFYLEKLVIFFRVLVDMVDDFADELMRV